MRRPSRSGKAGITISPPSKHSKKQDDANSIALGSNDPNAYERNVEFLQQSFHSKKWSVSSMTVLLGETAKQRRHWITTESPPVKAILEKFPCLADPQVVSSWHFVFHSYNYCVL